MTLANTYRFVWNDAAINRGKKGRTLLYIAMLSSILRRERAIDGNIRIMRAFVAMRRFVSDHAGLVRRVDAIELKQLETVRRE